MEPLVSVPTASGARPAATATAEPELEPQGLRSRAYGFSVRPPRALQPLVDWRERKLAHSLRLVLATSSAPAARRRAATPESRGAPAPTRASEPAVVCIRSAVPILSFSITGIPCRGPRVRPLRRSASSRSASARASGLISITERSAGPAWSTAATASRQASHRARAVQRPACKPWRNAATESSANSLRVTIRLSGPGRRAPQPGRAKAAAPAPNASRRLQRLAAAFMRDRAALRGLQQAGTGWLHARAHVS